MKKIFDSVKFIADTIQKDKVTIYSAQASFFIIISSVPFIMLLFIFAGNLMTATKDDIMLLFTALPKSVYSFVSFILDEILNKDIVPSISFSAVTLSVMLLWTSSRSVLALGMGLNHVYHSESKRGVILSNIYALIYTVALLVIIILSLVLIVFGNTIGNMLAAAFPTAAKIVDTILSARAIVSIVILTVVFSFMYTFMPSRKLKFFKQLPGALFAASGWIIFSLLFSIYIDNFSNKSYIYGSLTAIIIMMLWIYFCMIILFIGGEINYFLLDAE